MTERPILFTGAMVRAILAGEKTETRRVVRWRPASPADVSATRPPDQVQAYTHIPGAWLGVWVTPTGWSHEPTPCPYGVPGDRLWVRETWAAPTDVDDRSPTAIAEACRAAGYSTPWAPIWYAADGAHNDGGSDVGWGGRGRWRPSIHMPRWASRLTLRVESVRVERLTAIDDMGAIAEGCGGVMASRPGTTPRWADSPRDQFRRLWESINGKRPGCAWADDPWVWVVAFSRETP